MLLAGIGLMGRWRGGGAPATPADVTPSGDASR